jgi:putative tryptophan/tyrosine transport system substrate-binding protein
MKTWALVPMLVLRLLAAPLAAEAQPAGKVFRIGWLGFALPTSPEVRALEDAFVEALRAHGFMEGQNVVIERRYEEGRAERAAASATELVQMKVDVIVVVSSLAARAAKQATSTIPIVMVAVSHPVPQGLVASLARPGGNVTGMAMVAAEQTGKFLQILKEALPQRSRVAILWNPDNPASERGLKETDVPTAKALGMEPIAVGVRSAADLERAFETVIRERADVLYPHLALWAHRARIQEFAVQHRRPTVVLAREWSQLGVLISYGPDFRDLFQRSAMYVAKILRGAKSADLPVEQPTKFELVINLKTAKALGLTIPQSILARADEIIQ